MIKNGIFGLYKENEYKLIKKQNGNVIILTDNINIVDDSFEDKYNSGMYRKEVQRQDILSVYNIVTYGIIDDNIVNIEGEDNRYYSVGTSNSKIAESLNLKRCDKYYYNGKIEKENVKLYEQKVLNYDF